MTKLIIMMMCLIMSFIFMQMKHPLSMGLMLLIQTFLTCLITGIYVKSFWFSYVLFLIFLGGMLILFIYVTSLSSNEMFTMSFKLTMFSLVLFSLSMVIFFILDKTLIEQFIINMEMEKFSMTNNLINENILSLNKMYNFPTNLITLLLINYLFLTLLVTVKITKKFYGPLRPMN
ncbi:NADH dehydrogenase subunit 6 (mitochondrion) [Anopheles arabiensis]|uniref:NADH-ubiquinone oxidoreductase chain 6 n=4 Tax=gambiae species complex TaxID=44542 RepID=NU6M_ANOGA|nr:NADH dehydrogenase subunit 6 [Anopheles arabiensis]YP_009176725.1 NADH dehydrogenase subunit 6 [Anopheles melas]YP_010510791.1 NADH dehydrogenase subunit 6 [Anopheles coluzzii]YP_010963488.1 NADH dehydrogenase subunit 6 [Anopheles gambiae]P34856.2 RecName: Full=NADH-ubiquinone oxidoreductase chain 6; AltName: Full=NADH dehydrogenase subunit 6 [Anopheles gambiae]AAD12200.1 NADH dehydrogenase subunit 6 [Anopheles gambiae]ALJ02355.1 NADH dehydrogenase subunit 6 [Anopheles arabiensis]ALJ02446